MQQMPDFVDNRATLEPFGILATTCIHGVVTACAFWLSLHSLSRFASKYFICAHWFVLLLRLCDSVDEWKYAVFLFAWL